MKRFKLLLLVGLALAGELLPAQTAKPAERPLGRYLFIVETSSGMRRRAGAVQDTVQSLLRSDFNGQLRRGDTLGIWTFNEQLYAGQFPLQSWTLESRDAVTLAVDTFLKLQRYEKQTRLENILSELERVLKTSETITVLLVSAGEKEIPGPLFGSEINATYAQWFREMDRTRMPFITVLRARNGQLVGRSVNMAPWPVTFPEFPREPAPVVAAKPPQNVPAKKPAPAPAPKPRAPIVLDMSQSAKAEAKDAGKAATATTGQSTAPSPVPAEPATPAAKVQEPQIPQATVAPAAIPKPAESLPVTTVVPGQVQPVASPSQLPSTPGETPKSEGRQPAATSPVVGGTPQSQTTPPPAPAPPVSFAVPKPEPPVAAVTPAARVEKARIPVAEPETGKSQPTAAVEAKPTSSSGPTAATPPPPLEARPAATQAEPRETASSPSQTAVTVPPETIFTSKMLIVAALVLLAVVVVLLVLFLRRTRTTAHASLITRSMDRKED